MPDTISRTLYKKVANDLRSQIVAGALQVGDKIPSTPELSTLYSVSATAARNAVAVLREEGLLEGVPGKGVFVLATPADVDERRLSVESVHEEVSALRQEVQSLGQRIDDSQPSDVTAKVDELAAAVGQLQADLRALYDRMGQPYPHNESATKPRRRKSGA